MASKDSVKLTHPNGTTVSVRKEKAERLEAMGFTKSASRSGSSKSSD